MFSICRCPLSFWFIAFCSLASFGQQEPNAAPIRPNASFEVSLGPAQSYSYSIGLEKGDTALIIVRQGGIDVVVEVRDSRGKLLSSIDSPTGRAGDEAAELLASETGVYSIRVRPYDDKEPTGKFRIQYVSLLNAKQSADVIQSAKSWLKDRTTQIPATGIVQSGMSLKMLDRLVSQARVIGIGEATHGSREFGDLRLSLTQHLIQQNGYRIVAIEGSVSRFLVLNSYIRGQGTRDAGISKRIETGWIGRRTQRELIEWVRNWNIRHPQDRVRIVGLDPQDNQDARNALGAFIAKAYGEKLIAKWKDAATELAAADEQALVFGDSGVNAATNQLLLEINAMFAVDAPMWRARYGSEFELADEAARMLLEMADFNSNGEGSLINHSRDWYMATRLLRSLQEGGVTAKAVYWAHNGHVVHTASSTRTAGELLRNALACQYVSLAVTFGQGAFVAQIPNDVEDRLAVSSLPQATSGSVEFLLSQLGPGAPLVTWGCGIDDSQTPTWFRIPRQMHWVGGLYEPDTNPVEAFRPYKLLSDFDGVVCLPKVAADEVPTDRPIIPARKR